MDWEKQTLEFYNTNTDGFITGTLAVDMGETRKRFTAHLPPDAYILDLGCGSGRDTKAFLDAGYRVDAADGSEEICRQATEYTGIPVRKMLFSELEPQDTYDGIWACASILHLPRKELSDVIRRIENALKEGGVLYASFKYGDFEGIRNGRYFTNFTEETLKAFWKETTSLQIFDMWISRDVRPDRKEEQWINILARRDSK